MVGRITTRQTFVAALALAALLVGTRSTFAQGAMGMVEGTVKDAKGELVAGAVVTFRSTDGKYSAQAKTNSKGQFTQIGLYPTEFELVATFKDMESLPVKMNITPSTMSKADLTVNDKKTIAAGQSAASDKGKAEQAAKDKVAKLFGEGVTASNAGNFDEAIAKFTDSIAISPQCNVCYTNIGVAYLGKKDYPNAETNFKKALELNANDPEAYNGLSAVYNAQKKFEQAAEMSGKAAALAGTGAPGGAPGGGNPDALYSQAANLFNAGKMAEAKPLLEQVTKTAPNHADAHYLLGLALAADDPKQAKTEIETYLKLSPNGSNAPTAKAVLSELQKIVK
jgi:tetratricopeptide (TPR) repeat protein